MPFTSTVFKAITESFSALIFFESWLFNISFASAIISEINTSGSELYACALELRDVKKNKIIRKYIANFNNKCGAV